ncbi:MAG: hypothetical protein M0Q92_11575 [Methanoregula sp.]|jgi:hypothetical protein|nr:hypothetical protein [Methanoregula sp.]
MNKSLKLSLLAGLMVLLVLAVPSVSAFEISGMYTEEGQKWLNEHWGEKITLGELAKIAYAPEDYEKIKANVDSKVLENVWSQHYYWGERYPPEVVTPGPKIFDENNKLVEDPDGSILAGIESGRIKSLRSGIIVNADPVEYDGTYITYGGNGAVYGHTGHIDHFIVEAKLHGDGNLLQTSYKQRFDYTNNPRLTLITSGVFTPVSGTLYQSQTVGQSTSPDHTASTWSSSYLY